MKSIITPNFPAELENACRISKEQKVEYYGKLLATNSGNHGGHGI